MHNKKKKNTDPQQPIESKTNNRYNNNTALKRTAA